jgi:transcriptional regulator with XRE-family HTH domain
MTGQALRAKRAVAGVPGAAISIRTGIPRSRLSHIERGYLVPTADEVQRIESAIDEIIRTKHHLTKLADEAGLSLAGVRL